MAGGERLGFCRVAGSLCLAVLLLCCFESVFAHSSLCKLRMVLSSSGRNLRAVRTTSHPSRGVRRAAMAEGAPMGGGAHTRPQAARPRSLPPSALRSGPRHTALTPLRPPFCRRRTITAAHHAVGTGEQTMQGGAALLRWDQHQTFTCFPERPWWLRGHMAQ